MTLQKTSIAICFLLVAGATLPAAAQNNNLRQSFRDTMPLSMAEASIVRPAPVEPRTLKLHDKISVRVEELARTESDGEVQQRKNMSYNAAILDWVRLNGLRKAESTQADGVDPTIQGNLTQLVRNEAELETTERLTFNIAAEIVDILPNGTLVVEARKEIRINNESWLTTLSGKCRQEDIGIDGVVFSSDIMDVRINKRELGRVRDGYKRGWLHRILDQITPF